MYHRTDEWYLTAVEKKIVQFAIEALQKHGATKVICFYFYFEIQKF